MATHIKKLNIYSYRGISDLLLKNLGSVNIIVGDNNVGKTSVLEAIQFICSPNTANMISVARQREKNRLRMSISYVDSVKYLFDVNTQDMNSYMLSIDGVINNQEGRVDVIGSIETELLDVNELARKNGYSRTGRMEESAEEVEIFCGNIKNTFISNKQREQIENDVEHFEITNFSRYRMNAITENMLVKSRMISTVDHIMENSFSSLIRNSHMKDEAVSLLKSEFDSDICDLRIISDSNTMRFVPVVETNSGEYIPLSLYGDGMKKALIMLNGIINAKDGVVLIDEFETALHTSAMGNVFHFLVESSLKNNIQLFLTTHSIEAVDKLLEFNEERLEDIRVIRLKKKNRKTYSKVLSGYEALSNRKDYDMELRE